MEGELGKKRAYMYIGMEESAENDIIAEKLRDEVMVPTWKANKAAARCAVTKFVCDQIKEDRLFLEDGTVVTDIPSYKAWWQNSPASLERVYAHYRIFYADVSKSDYTIDRGRLRRAIEEFEIEHLHMHYGDAKYDDRLLPSQKPLPSSTKMCNVGPQSGGSLGAFFCRELEALRAIVDPDYNKKPPGSKNLFCVRNRDKPRAKGSYVPNTRKNKKVHKQKIDWVQKLEYKGKRVAEYPSEEIDSIFDELSSGNGPRTRPQDPRSSATASESASSGGDNAAKTVEDLIAEVEQLKKEKHEMEKRNRKMISEHVKQALQAKLDVPQKDTEREIHRQEKTIHSQMSREVSMWY
jgi:hypothetical protein